MDVAVYGDIDFIALPEFLETFPSHGLCKRPLVDVEVSGRVSQHSVSQKDEPRLFLAIHRSKAVLYELVLLAPFSPVVLRVRYAEPEHSIVRRVPAFFFFLT